MLDRYKQFFCTSDLLLIPLTTHILEKATELRAFHNLRTPDALQAATALSLDDDFIFITGLPRNGSIIGFFVKYFNLV